MNEREENFDSLVCYKSEVVHCWYYMSSRYVQLSYYVLKTIEIYDIL